MTDQTRITVRVQPNAGRNAIAGLTDGVWRIKVAAPPEKDKANQELLSFLSDILRVKKGRVNILKGHTSHSKILFIEGLTNEDVVRRLSGKK
jgi:uncharacterized protein (TIGR00251 family)